MSFKKVFFKATMAVFLGLAAISVKGAPTPDYEPFVPSPEFIHAEAVAIQGDLETARQLFAQIGAQNPGKTLGANALMRQAHYAEDAEAIQIFQQVIASYPGSGFEITSKLCILERQTPSREPMLRACDQLAQSYGGPSVAEILRDHDRALTRLRTLSLDTLDGLALVYDSIQGETQDLQRWSQAAELARFNRDGFFPVVKGDQAGKDMLFCLSMGYLGTWVGSLDPPVDPKVRLVTQEGESGPRPKLVLQVQTGPGLVPQTDLSSLNVTLDGTNFLPNMVVSSKLTHSKAHRRFSLKETVRLSGRPVQPLAKGPHVLDVTVSVSGYQQRGGTGPGKTHKTFTFFVRRDRDEDEDECEGAAWGRGED